MSLKTKVLTAAAFAALLASTAVQAVTYTVGTGATYRPFEYEAPNKEIVGFDIDLMKAIAKAQGFDVEFVNTTWSTIFPALNNGDRDIIMSGITITDKRKEAVDFSEPYFLAHQPQGSRGQADRRRQCFCWRRSRFERLRQGFDQHPPF